MKIWIDYINTPQVTFFVPFIRDFKNDNHEILLTCRDSGNTIDLLEQHKLPYYLVGEKVGKGIIQKIVLFPLRLVSLFFFILKHKPDIAVSQSSFYQPLVAKLLRIPCLYTNDNEHAKGNLFGFLFADKVILPMALQNLEITKRFPLKSKISFYPSVKEAVYLSQFHDLQSLAAGPKSKIYFRPEPWSAQYYKGPFNFFDDILLKLSKEYNVVVLPRDKKQTVHFRQHKFITLSVSEKPLVLDDIVADCLLFIGAGGSMTREMAVLEIPVISIYHSELLCVDKSLVNKGLMIVKPDITYEEIKIHINSGFKYMKGKSALTEGEKSYNLLKNLIYDLIHK